MKALNKEWKNGKDIGLLLFRLVLGVSMFLGHGLPKWNVLLSGGDISFPDPLGIGTNLSFYLVLFAEGVAFVFIILGLYTRLALIPLIVAMFVAAFVFHSGQPFGKIELPLIYFVSFVALFFTGAGKYSVDARLK